MTAVRLLDPYDVADIATFVGCARTADPDGAIRLQADGNVLALTVAVLPGSGVLGAGVVLGMRALRLTAPARVDAVVGLQAVEDRLARLRREGGTYLTVPPATVFTPWAGLAPPRSGWDPVGTVTSEEVRAAARSGIEEVARGAPAGSRESAVAELRRRVWSRGFGQGALAVPAGLAFGAHALGFVGPEPSRLFRNGPWLRLATNAGEVLTR